MTIRAVRNNNPGNINAGQPWQGLMPRGRMTPEQAAEPRFAVFESPEWGFRALCLVLLSYDRQFTAAGKPFTITTIISRWAPPAENNTPAYVAHVCALTAFSPNQNLTPDLTTICALAKAISTHEVGTWAFQDADLTKGATLAGL